MLRRLLHNLRTTPPTSAPNPDKPHVTEADLQDAPWRRHFEILHGATRIGDLDYIDLFWRCANDTDTAIYPHNLFRRAQAGINLARYFLSALEIDGARAECGVYRGMSSLLMCRAAQAVQPGFSGEHMHLFDSFERFSEPTAFDMINSTDEHGTQTTRRPFPVNSRLNTSLAEVQQALAEFPKLVIRQGWVPQVLEQLPEQVWSFVHLDVDLYEPTLGGLEYFYPRLSVGGIIITDDYGTQHYPGARKAWQKFCTAGNIPYSVFETGQAAIIRS